MEQQPVSSSAHDSLRSDLCVEQQPHQIFNPIDSEVSMHFFSFKGHKVRYLKKGTGAPLILLHNAGNDHRIWDYQIEYFAKSYEVYAVDNLGYGISDKPELDYTLRLYSQMVKALIEEVGLQNVIIIGQCIGAAMALNYTLRNPDKVKALILFNTATIDGLKHGSLGFLYKLTRFKLIKRIAMPVVRRLIITRWKAIQDINQQYGEIGESNSDFIEHLVKLYKHPKQLRILASLLFNFDSFASMNTIKKPDNFPPVYLIWGARNNILPLKTGVEFCGRLEPDHKEFVEDCGHLVMREKPEKINRLIDFFIEQWCAETIFTE